LELLETKLHDCFFSLAEKVVAKNKQMDTLELAVKELEIRTEKKLNEFYKEFSEKQFTVLEAFLRWNKEISLVSFLGGKEPDLNKLKKELERPMVEYGWSKTQAEEADKINKALQSKGEKIRRARDTYREDLLKAEREGKNTELLKAKLEILDKLMDGVE
jgi:hypothetical protein